MSTRTFVDFIFESNILTKSIFFDFETVTSRKFIFLVEILYVNLIDG